MGRGKIAGNGIHLRLSLLEPDSRMQPGNGVQIAIITLRRIDQFGNPEIHRIANTRDNSGRQTEIGTERREMRVGRSDAGNQRRRRPDAAQIDEVDIQNLAKEFPVRCEATLPEAAADNDLEPPPLWIIRTERFAHQRYAENFEELRRDAEPAQAFASISPGQIHSLPPIAGDGIERFRLSLPVE